ncbi:unnamed protein product [Rotaria magnacalcarata]|uniref:Uncharacterized protein n=1 Tax=Rotaria magnacalcarata TaxID=392030 RepID=A0A816WFN7_9BILA|nr:unnamed protein product [Rotaria magnacalcarata]CAF1481187.1 unnamed protein product [Rotaria magnacalcarata]CAF2047572.1 unnamed protein product [Rotaria magnacalcarata]CAF2125294.1 unnamed protein product [Rotaria magnacalcarata]CAF2161117.1 unnamed protein product [Rotaria magnacalcarata]
MIQNSTVTVVETTATTISTAVATSAGYDNTGAMIYIIIVLLWYSIGIIFMLGMQMKARSEIIEEAARRRTKRLIRNLRDQTNTKEILEELADKQKRARLWEIYLGTKDERKTKLTEAETVRIRHIEKQLATLKRDRRLTNEALFASEAEKAFFRSRSDARQMTAKLSTIEEPSLLRRRSSFDPQTLERWKALANQSKSHEQMPWNTRKLVIRRYFRRLTGRPSSTTHQDSETTTENLLSFANQITTLARPLTEINLDEISSSDERQNPYLTYFYKPTSRPSILATQFFPTSSEPSIT